MENRINKIQKVYDAEIELVMAQSEILLQRKKGGFSGELKSAGTIIENYVKGLLKSHLPSGYRICSGFISTATNSTDSNNLMQHDILIIDDRFPSIYMFSYSDIEVVAAESVVGIFEVKRTLSKKSLVSAINHLKETSSILARYKNGIKSKNTTDNNVGPSMSMSTLAPIYGIISLQRDEQIVSEEFLLEHVNDEISSFLDLIWSLTDGFSYRFQIKDDKSNYIPRHTSRNIDANYSINCTISQLTDPNEFGGGFREILSTLRYWLSNTCGKHLSFKEHREYLG